MTTYTDVDLATRVLKDLGLIAADETPSAEDLDWATETCGTEIAMLGIVGMPIWNGSETTIPQEYLGALSRRIGLAMAVSFGLMSPVEAEKSMTVAEQNLRKLAMTTGTGSTLEGEYI